MTAPRTIHDLTPDERELLADFREAPAWARMVLIELAARGARLGPDHVWIDKRAGRRDAP